jgi:hypothetical protein
MQHYIIISLVIFWTMYAGAHVNTIADVQYRKYYLQADFDKMVYDDTIQKYYDVTILEVWKAPWKHDSGESTGIYIEVAYKKKSYLVPIAPCWYFDDIDSFKVEKKITIFGVESVIQGKNIILPKLIKNESDLWLRNYDGKPFWVIASKNDSLRKMDPNGKKGPGQGGPGAGGGGKPPF